MKNKIKSSRISVKAWVSIVLFGIIGQIAWVVENMYFATFAQNLFSNTQEFGNMYYIATTLMVVFSAITATGTTILIGGLIDKMGKRKVFVSFGFLLWGITIMLFAAIPMSFHQDKAITVMSLLVFFDCIMTFFGSTAYDAGFNAWVTDITDVTNRGKVDAILSIMPLLATAITVLLAMFTFDKGSKDAEMYKLFFIIIGVLPIVAGLLSFILLKDAPNIEKVDGQTYLKVTLYGFKPSIIKENKMMYVALTVLCLMGISQQVYMSYLLNFITKTLGIEDYLFPLAGVGIISAVITGGFGLVFDKKGRKIFYIPILILNVISMFIVYALKYMPQNGYIATLIVVGGIMMGTSLTMFAALTAAFQDYIPKGNEGRFQGVRMCFSVLIPMILGPLISLAIGINSFDATSAAIAKPPFEIFLAGAIVALVAIIPIIFIVKDSDRLRDKLLKDKEEE